MKGLVTMEFLDYWHMGTGTGKGAYLDSLVARTPAGLPVVPGRTVKGLFREACQTAEELGHLQAGTCARLFGTGEGGSEHRVGTLSFTDADLGPEMEAWVAASNAAKAESAMLYRGFSATSLDERGIAQDGSLSTIEVVIPMTLTGEVEAVVEGPTDALRFLAEVAPLIRCAGTHRHRGFGRVVVKVEEVRS